MSRSFLLLLTLVSVTHSANIFMTSMLDGSLFTSIHDIAIILASAGHNVTFLTLVDGVMDGYPDNENIHHISSVIWKKGEAKELIWTECIENIVKAPISDAGTVIGGNCSWVWSHIFKKSAAVFCGDDIVGMFNNTKFDVIVGEGVSLTGISILGTVVNVPVVDFEAAPFITNSLVHNNLPTLLFSQPSILYNHGYEKPYSLAERIYALKPILNMYGLMTDSAKALEPFLIKWGLQSSQIDVSNSVKLFLANDHPAFTFPVLRPPNNIPIGCANLLHIEHRQVHFDPPIKNFLELSTGKDVIYMSFGTYISIDSVPWFSQLIEMIIELNANVIAKSHVAQYSSINEESVLLLKWVPQKDLLKSGRIKLFISHCGNNGRLESTYYSVPLLCVPQAGDQLSNAEIIKYKGFGEILLKQDIPNSGKEKIKQMLLNIDSYKSKMEIASGILKNEPGNVKENLIFHIGHLAKYGEVDYLVNHVIRQQNVLEIYHVDIIIMIFILVLCIMGSVFYITKYLVGKFIKLFLKVKND